MSQQNFYEAYGGSAPENYERYFTPAIGAPLATDLIDTAALRPSERVLDVACGTGVVARLAAERVGATGTVAGIDINPGMLAVARSVTPPGMSIEWYETSAEAIPLPDEAFDTFVDLVFSLHDTGDLQHLINDAGFREAAIHSDTKTLRLPTPEEFLWQCVQSTPTGECGGAGG